MKKEWFELKELDELKEEFVDEYGKDMLQEIIDFANHYYTKKYYGVSSRISDEDIDKFLLVKINDIVVQHNMTSEHYLDWREKNRYRYGDLFGVI